MNQTFIKMNFFKRNKDIESRNLEYLYPFSLQFSNTTSFSNAKVLALSAVYRCVQVISDSVASLPLEPYQNVNGYKQKLTKHPLFNLLTIEPNSSMGRYMFFKNIVTNILLKGNAYILIFRDKKNVVQNLRLLNSDSVLILQVDGDIKYKDITDSKIYNKADIIHIMNYTENGINGQSVIYHAVNTLQLSSDAESHARGFFRGGANLAGFIKTVSALTKLKAEELKQSFRDAFNPDSGNPNGLAILEGGMEYVPVTIKPSDSQLLETRKFNVVDVCRFFGVSPQKAFDIGGTTYSNIENAQLAFLTDTLTPLLEKIENEFHRKLFLPSERSSIELKFDISILLRADSASQADYFTKMHNIGGLTTNEIRQKLNQPPVSGGDRAFIQVNLQPLDNLISEQSNQPNQIDNKLK